MDELTLNETMSAIETVVENEVESSSFEFPKELSFLNELSLPRGTIVDSLKNIGI